MGTRYGKCSFVRIIRMRSSSSVCVCVWAWLPMVCWGPHLHALSCVRPWPCRQCIARMLPEGGWRLADGNWRLTKMDWQLALSHHHTHYGRVNGHHVVSILILRVCIHTPVCPCVYLQHAPKRPCQAAAHVRMLMTLMIYPCRRPSIGSHLTPTCTLQIFPVHHTHWPLVRPLAYSHPSLNGPTCSIRANAPPSSRRNNNNKSNHIYCHFFAH